MEREAIRKHVQQEPFVPFRIITSAGDRYEVRSPDQVWLLKTRVFVALPPQKGDVPDEAAYISLLHVVGVEELHAA